MTREQLLAMQRGYAELEAFELEERKAATPAQRMAQLDAIWRLSIELGLPLKPDNPTTYSEAPWASLRGAIHGRRRASTQ